MLTSRPDPRILALFGGPSLDLNDDVPYAAANVDDVAAYVYGRLENFELPQSDRLNLSYRLAEASEGNFLFASVASGEMLAHPERIDQVGDWTNLGLEGLAGIYRNLIDRELGAM